MVYRHIFDPAAWRPPRDAKRRTPAVAPDLAAACKGTRPAESRAAMRYPGGPARTSAQGHTLVHFSAQRKRILWSRESN